MVLRTTINKSIKTSSENIQERTWIGTIERNIKNEKK